MNNVYYNEISPWPCAVLRARIADGRLPSGVVDERDIRLVRPDDLEGFRQCHFFAGIGGFPLGLILAGWPNESEIWTGGFPCQDISVAGKGKGITGLRSRMYWELFRLVSSCRPKRLLLENSPALRSRGADSVLDSLEGIGYACWPIVVGAWTVGAKHRRDRVFVACELGPDADRDGELQPDRSEREFGDRVSDGGPGVVRPYTTFGRLGTDGGAPRDAGHTDECGSLDGIRPDAAIARLEGRREELFGPGGFRGFPARIRDPQHEWERPRLFRSDSASLGLAERSGLGRESETTRGWRSDAGYEGGDGCQQSAELPVGAAIHGLPGRLDGPAGSGDRENRRLLKLAKKANKEGLKAVGNAVVPQVVAAIASAWIGERVQQVGGAM